MDNSFVLIQVVVLTRTHSFSSNYIIIDGIARTTYMDCKGIVQRRVVVLLSELLKVGLRSWVLSKEVVELGFG